MSVLYLCPTEGCTARLYDEPGGTKLMCHVHSVLYEEAPDPAEVGLENLVVGDNYTYASAPLGDPNVAAATSHVVTGIRNPQEQAALDEEAQVVEPDNTRMRNRYADVVGSEPDEAATVEEMQADIRAAQAGYEEVDEDARREEQKANLRQQFEDLTGEKPDKRWGPDRLQQEIFNHRADQEVRAAQEAANPPEPEDTPNAEAEIDTSEDPGAEDADETEGADDTGDTE